MELQTFITKNNLGENLNPFIIPSFYYNLKNDKNVISYNYLNFFQTKKKEKEKLHWFFSSFPSFFGNQSMKSNSKIQNFDTKNNG